MGYHDGAMGLVRAELCDRLEVLRGMSGRISHGDFTGRVQGMRNLAAAYGMTPVVRLAEALERTLAESAPNLHRCPTQLFLARLEDAIGCERADEQASQAMIASVSVRLSA
jgi:hypothetical protein